MALADAELAPNRARAYDLFDDFLAEDYRHEKEDEICQYLLNQECRYRSRLLAAMADREYPLDESMLMSLMLNLLIHPDPDIRRHAAMAMYYGGEDSHNLLRRILTTETLKDYRDDLSGLVDFLSKL